CTKVLASSSRDRNESENGAAFMQMPCSWEHADQSARNIMKRVLSKIAPAHHAFHYDSGSWEAD
ncbi:MAG: hypothetical protein Q8L40_07695, partial [Burkholderiales bacterium]|nr:hypothetical protein [Burkholderiales bacterium]